MRKRCTNSACRKTFFYPKGKPIVCSACGKQYLRGSSRSPAMYGGKLKLRGSDRYLLFSMSANGEKIRAIKYIKHFFTQDKELSLKDSKMLIEGEKLLDIATTPRRSLSILFHELSVLGCKVTCVSEAFARSHALPIVSEWQKT